MEHIFDEESLMYGSETGNWHGKCRDCGIELTVYTGAASLQPTGANTEEPIRFFGRQGPEGSVALPCSFEEFMKGRPNMLVKYQECRPTSRPKLL